MMSATLHTFTGSPLDNLYGKRTKTFARARYNLKSNATCHFIILYKLIYETLS